MSSGLSHTSFIHARAEDTDHRIGLGVVLGAGNDAWQQYEAFLSGPEYAQLQRQRTQEARNSFCLGRMAAKSAAGKLTGNAASSVSVGHGIFGFPVIEPNPDGICLSIAHTGSSGAALCYSEKLLMGIDMELIRETNSPAMLSTFTEQEKQMRIAGLDALLRHHLLWSAREALSKALRTGFLVPLPLLEVSSIAPTPYGYKMGFVHFSLFEAIAFELGDYLLAMVFPKKLQVDMTFAPRLSAVYEEYIQNNTCPT